MYVNIGDYDNVYRSWNVFNFVFGKIFKMSELKVHQLYGKNSHMLKPFIRFLNKNFNKDTERKVEIRIDTYDIYSVDSTLALIIEPLLIQLRNNMNGSPFIENEDVPAKLRATKTQKENFMKLGTTDKKYHKRFEYVVDEMIWAFTELNKQNSDNYYTSSELKLPDKEWAKKYRKTEDRKQNGFRLFGKYYSGLWS